MKVAGAKLEKFLVAGASKRGWTTWTTMAVDKRVFAGIPIVMDMLRLNTVTPKSYLFSLFNIKFSILIPYFRIFTIIIDHWE